MKITVNSREMIFYKSTLQELIDQYKMNPDKISVNKNDEEIEKERFRIEMLQEGDVIDIGRRRQYCRRYSDYHLEDRGDG